MLWRGSNLRQTYYNAADLRFSDHRPVCAKFVCMINIIDESLKGELRHALYSERQYGMHKALAKGTMQDIPDKDIIQPGYIMPTLPPSSSDNQRWWLNDGRWLNPPFFSPLYTPLSSILFAFLTYKLFEFSLLTIGRCSCEVNYKTPGRWLFRKHPSES